MNGVWLPAWKKSANPLGKAVHATLHKNAYYQAVNDALAGATTREQALDILNAIGNALESGGFP